LVNESDDPKYAVKETIKEEERESVDDRVDLDEGIKSKRIRNIDKVKLIRYPDQKRTQRRRCNVRKR
jgi:hypothetical protein